MSQLVNYSIIEAGLRALADKAHESAVALCLGELVFMYLYYVVGLVYTFPIHIKN